MEGNLLGGPSPTAHASATSQRCCACRAPVDDTVECPWIRRCCISRSPVRLFSDSAQEDLKRFPGPRGRRPGAVRSGHPAATLDPPRDECPERVGASAVTGPGCRLPEAPRPRPAGREHAQPGPRPTSGRSGGLTGERATHPRCITLNFKVRLVQGPLPGKSDPDPVRRPVAVDRCCRPAPVGQARHPLLPNPVSGRQGRPAMPSRGEHVCPLRPGQSDQVSVRASPLPENRAVRPTPTRPVRGTGRVGRRDQIIGSRFRPCTPWWTPTPHWCRWRWWPSPSRYRCRRVSSPPP